MVTLELLRMVATVRTVTFVDDIKTLYSIESRNINESESSLPICLVFKWQFQSNLLPSANPELCSI